MGIYIEFSVLCDRCCEAEITGPGGYHEAERSARESNWTVQGRTITCSDCRDAPIERSQDAGPKQAAVPEAK